MGVRRRRKLAGTSTGLAAGELQAAASPGAVAELHRQIETDGGKAPFQPTGNRMADSGWSWLPFQLSWLSRHPTCGPLERRASLRS